MNEVDGFYQIPLMPKGTLTSVEETKLRKAFVKAKAEYLSWARKDRDSRMNPTAKAILSYLLDCLNFETGQCDPAHQTIADELGFSVRTVERTIPRIAASGWLKVIRRGRTTTNFYTFAVSKAKVLALLDYTDDLRELRKEARERRRRFSPHQSDPTKVADHSESDPTIVRSHDPTELAAHDPTKMAGKHMKRTPEGEPLNISGSSKREISMDTYPREDIPTDESKFNAWISQNIPDPSFHRKAYELLRDRKMTPEMLRRIAA